MRVQIGAFVVDDTTRQVLRDGTVVHLSPKAFDLLAMLISDRPRALTKAELQSRLWPRTFVSDTSLAMLVSEVRAALGETARQPRYLRTVHRHGYAFQGAARETATAAPTSDAASGYWVVTSSRQIPLLPGENIVGRDPKARIWLDSPSVSRRHARVTIDGARATVQDLDSKNGTRVRGARIAGRTPLADGDQLRFGSIGMTFRVWAADLTRSEGDPA